MCHFEIRHRVIILQRLIVTHQKQKSSPNILVILPSHVTQEHTCITIVTMLICVYILEKTLQVQSQHS